MKKVLLMLLGVLMALPAFARDFSYTYEGQTITYTVLDENAKTVQTKAGNNPSAGNEITGNLILPSNPMDGNVKYTLTKISDNAFYGCRGLTSVNIPNSVTEIGRLTFSWCSSLTSVTIPNSVTKIGDYAFYACRSLISVNIPNSVTEIGDYAFDACSSLTSVTIPNSVTEIGSAAFSNCSGMVSIVSLAETPPAIQANSFGGLYNTVEVTVPDNSLTEYLLNSAWSQFSNIKTAGGFAATIFTNDIFQYRLISENSVMLVAGNYYGETEVAVPDQTVFNEKFHYVTHIGINAFKNCSNIVSLSLPKRLEGIYDNAFYGCRGLTSVIIPESVNSIGESAFSGCSSLTSIVALAETPPTIQTNSFEGLYNTAEVTVPDNSLAEYINSNWFLFVNLKTAGGFNTSVFSDDVFNFRLIGENSAMLVAGNYGSMTSVSIPERVVVNDKFHYVTSIGDGAFKNCKKITKLVLPKRLEVIGVSAFEGAKIPISDLSLPATLTKIHDSAFSAATGLSSITLPEQVNYIGNSAFAGSSVKTINLPVAPGTGCFKDAKQLSAVTFSEEVDTIASELFSGCTGLTSITIPEKVTSIGSSAFFNCSGLTKAEYASMEALCKIDFENIYANPLCYSHSLYINGQEITDVEIPASVTKLNGFTLAECSGIKSITIPNSVKSIGESALSGCSGLTSLTIPNSVESIGESALSGCSGLTSVTVGSSVNKIPNSAFNNCNSISTLRFEYSEKPIEICKMLTSNVLKLYLGRNLNIIGE